MSEPAAQVTIGILEEVSAADAAAIARLVPQLSSASPPDRASLQAIVGQEAVRVFVARAGDGELVGMCTLCLVQIPTGLKASIEDVVVDDSRRGQGIGEELMQAALAHASGRRARAVDLTSRPSRLAANRLYQKLGFVERDTNVYRFSFKS